MCSGHQGLEAKEEEEKDDDSLHLDGTLPSYLLASLCTCQTSPILKREVFENSETF